MIIINADGIWIAQSQNPTKRKHTNAYTTNSKHNLIFLSHRFGIQISYQTMIFHSLIKYKLGWHWFIQQTINRCSCKSLPKMPCYRTIVLNQFILVMRAKIIQQIMTVPTINVRFEDSSLMRRKWLFILFSLLPLWRIFWVWLLPEGKYLEPHKIIWPISLMPKNTLFNYERFRISSYFSIGSSRCLFFWNSTNSQDTILWIFYELIVWK